MTKGTIEIKYEDQIANFNVLNIREFDLFLGNGFSIYFHDNFDYKNLFEKLLNNVDDENKKEALKSFETYNFEEILKYFQTLKVLSEGMGWEISELGSEDFIGILKTNLVKIINEVHPVYSSLDKEKMLKWLNVLDSVKDIFTTNYDVILYNLFLSYNDYKSAAETFQDYFFRNINNDFTGFNDFQNLAHKGNVLYLHGALHIFESDSSVLKIKKSASLLVDIEKQIKKGNFPLFISEGKHKLKLDSIMQNNYLRFCFEKFQEADKTCLVVFGSSFSEFDIHIVEAIIKSRESVYISVYSDQEEFYKTKYMHDVINVFNKAKDDLLKKDSTINKTLNINFYESNSIFEQSQ